MGIVTFKWLYYENDVIKHASVEPIGQNLTQEPLAFLLCGCEGQQQKQSVMS